MTDERVLAEARMLAGGAFSTGAAKRVGQAYLDLLSRWDDAIEEAAKAAGAAAWKHLGDDAYSRGMDAGAAHQVVECVKAIRSLRVSDDKERG